MYAADPLTKRMIPTLLVEVMSSGRWSVKQPEESRLVKERKHQQRRKTVDEGVETEGDGAG